LVVDAAVDDTGVVACLVLRGCGFTFHDDDRVVRASRAPFARDCESDDPGADDD
jgi:predicted Zn-ribbon and HTH transcriptional regulator